MFCPNCGRQAEWDEAANTVSCVDCDSQYKILFLGTCPEQFKEE